MNSGVLVEEPLPVGRVQFQYLAPLGEGGHGLHPPGPGGADGVAAVVGAEHEEAVDPPLIHHGHGRRHLAMTGGGEQQTAGRPSPRR